MRRQRTFNSLLHVDSVKELPGINYCEWIKITKYKLISREKTLLNTRIETIESNANIELQSSYDSQGINDINKRIKYAISQNICKNLYDAISYTINQWQGVELTKRHSSKPYTAFREYFIVGKNWWDQKKTNVYGPGLWVQVLKDIQKFALVSVSKDKCLFYKILVGLFQAEVKYPNTKDQPLIPIGVIKNCKELKAFLFNLNHSLDIDSWLRKEIINKKETDKKNNKTKKRTGHAKVIAKQLKINLIHLAKSTERLTVNRYVNNNSNNSNINRQTEEQKVQPTSHNNNINNNINNNYDQLIFSLADAFISNNNSNNNNQINNVNNNYNMNNMNSMNNMNNMNNMNVNNMNVNNNQQQSNTSTIIIIPVLQAPIIPPTYTNNNQLQTQTYSTIMPNRTYNRSRNAFNATSPRYNPLNGNMRNNSNSNQLYKQQ